MLSSIVCDTEKESFEREQEAFSFHRTRQKIPEGESRIINTFENPLLRVNTLWWDGRDVISVYTIRHNDNYCVFVLVLPHVRDP